MMLAVPVGVDLTGTKLDERMRCSAVLGDPCSGFLDVVRTERNG